MSNLKCEVFLLYMTQWEAVVISPTFWVEGKKKQQKLVLLSGEEFS